MVFGAVEEIGHVEDNQREVVGGVDRGIDIAQEPLVVVQPSLLETRARAEAVSGATVPASEQVGVGGVDVVALVELALEPRQADEYREVLPHVGIAQPDGLPHAVTGPKLRPGDLAAPDLQDAGALQAVEVLGEAPAIGAQEVALDEQHDQRVRLIEGIEHWQEIARVAVGGDGEQIAQRRREQRCELLFRQQLEERGLEVVDAVLERGQELHGRCRGRLEGRIGGLL